MTIRPTWATRAQSFIQSLERNDGYASTPQGGTTLYGTCYALLSLHYLGSTPTSLSPSVIQFLQNCQDPTTGLILGPELSDYRQTGTHTKEHVILHSTCTALPVFREFEIQLPYKLKHAKDRFAKKEKLLETLDSVDFSNAWLEGNNLLFYGQLILDIRDHEKCAFSADALLEWFRWLDDRANRTSGLWGSEIECPITHAIYGGYHQLLVYWHENRPVPNLKGLVDSVLGIQHTDGSFSPNGNGGACEDVDAVDILVNCYKRADYRRPEIRAALRRSLKRILETQNIDGGFPYNLNCPQSHMGISSTRAAPNVSCAFPTWFRIHTLALIAEAIPSERVFSGVNFKFNSYLSMGWHRSPPGWQPLDVSHSWIDHIPSIRFLSQNAFWKIIRAFNRVKHGITTATSVRSKQ